MFPPVPPVRPCHTLGTVIHTEQKVPVDARSDQAARRPPAEEALELVSQALSDGDLEAALAQYEGQALLSCWPQLARRRDGDIRGALASFMALRLPLAVRITTVLQTEELALVICERRVSGTSPDGDQVRLGGPGCAVVRPQPDGSWRIAADAWHLSLDPPGLALAPGGRPGTSALA